MGGIVVGWAKGKGHPFETSHGKCRISSSRHSSRVELGAQSHCSDTQRETAAGRVVHWSRAPLIRLLNVRSAFVSLILLAVWALQRSVSSAACRQSMWYVVCTVLYSPLHAFLLVVNLAPDLLHPMLCYMRTYTPEAQRGRNTSKHGEKFD